MPIFFVSCSEFCDDGDYDDNREMFISVAWQRRE